jgi:2-(1,2-epoxy-1,2-dihydrophenyl)acetyl-CoA isomerase
MRPSNDRRALVRVDDDGGVRTLTLARPERHNALVPELLDDLVAAIEDGQAVSHVGALVLAAQGRSFSTGGDVAAFATLDGADRVAYARRIVGALNDAILTLLASDRPVVAAVHGPVTGGSLGLVLAADVVVVGPRAWFAPYYVDVGFSPDGGWTALLPQRIGALRAGAVQLLNQPVDAHTALLWGLATHHDDDPGARARKIATDIADKRPGSVARTRRLLAGDLDDVAARLDAELDSFVAQIDTPEATAGMAAFLAGAGPATGSMPA